MALSARSMSALKAAVFLAALVPVARIGWALAFDPDALGANPAEFITRSTGDWTLRFLLLTLAVTPLRKALGWHWLAGWRRMLGLYAFFYGVTHFASFVSFDHVFVLAEILKDIVKRPFITVGVTALALMLPLAITSTDRMVRRLGAKRWRARHRLVYLIAPLGVLHFWWMVKADLTEPAIYAALLTVLLGYRVAARLREAKRKAARNRRAPLPQPNA